MRFILILFCTLSLSTYAQMELSWSFLHPVKKEWMDLGTKGSVQEALIASGELPDPFYGINEEKFGWIEDHLWEFKSIFTVTKEQLNNDYLELEFPNIDTYGKVVLNDSLLLEAKNYFLPYSVQVKDLLKEGINELQITFTPPLIYHKDTKKEVGYQLPAPNDVSDNPIAPYVRKPQYQFGWDWALRMNTIGLNKPVVLHSYNNGRMFSKACRTLWINEDRAEIQFDVQLANSDIDEIQWESKLFGAMINSGKSGRFTTSVEMDNPELWWPNGQGEQHLYHDYVELKTKDGTVIEKFNWTFGVRKAELVQEEDEWGTSYYFKINGRPIFCKGGDYIPQDVFPARVTDDMVRDMVDVMKASNFNMVRVWGGGYYPDEVFYEMCDSLGIMVWQDLMFACAMYPGDVAFIDNVAHELDYQVPRIASHPSVVLFNGNNEVEVAWGNWGFQIKYGLYGESAKEIEKAYNDLFKVTAKNIVAESFVPYIHTSPLSNWGKKEYYNHGSQHYWGVWHGKDPIEDFGKKIGRFNAEYGFQSFPEYSTLLAFSDTTQWDLKNEVMKQHQKSYVGNDMILKHAKRLFGEPKDFEEFVYFSQLTQAMAVSMAVAGHRIDYPRCGGTLYWQLNDCWPAPTWSSIDYYNNWKALQYRIRDDYNCFSVLEKYDDLEAKSYYAVSDAPEEFNYVVEVKVYSLEGKKLGHKRFDLSLGMGKSELLDLDDLLKGIKEPNYLLSFKYKTHEGELCARTFENITDQYSKAEARDVEISLQNIDEESKTATIKIESTKFLRNFWISSKAFGVHFNRNFIDVMPGSSYIIIQYDELPELSDFILKWM